MTRMGQWLGGSMLSVAATLVAVAPAQAAPILTLDAVDGTATLDTGGASLTAFQIQSRGTNGAITAIGDADGFLLAGKSNLGSFFFNSSTRDEYGGSFGSLAAGVYDLGQLLDPTLLSLPATESLVLSDLRFGYDGDASAAGNGIVAVAPIPEPAAIGLAALGAVAVFRRRSAL